MSSSPLKFGSNIWKIYIISLLRGVSLFYDLIETLYYRHFHLSFQQLGFLISAILVAKTLLDIPTGAFADLYGRKKSLIISTACCILGMAFLALGSSFELFFFGCLLLGIGYAFNSGASNALLYESLVSIRKENQFLKHSSRIKSFSLSIDIVAGALAPLTYSFNVRLPFLISWGAFFIILPFQFMLSEKANQHSVSSFSTILKDQIGEIIKSFKIIRKQKMFIWLTLFSLLFFVLSSVFSQMISIPFLIDKGYSLKNISVMAVIWNIIQTSFMFFAYKIEMRFRSSKLFILIVLFISFILFLLTVRQNLISMAVLFGLYYGLMSFVEIVNQSYLNRNIESIHRATMLSISSMIVTTFTLIILPLFGLFIDKSSTWATLWLLSGCISLFGGFLLLNRPEIPAQ